MKEALAEHSHTHFQSLSGEKLFVGTIVGINRQGVVTVDFPCNAHGPVQAYYTNALRTQLERRPDDLINQKVLMVFEEQNLEFPIIVDTLHSKIENDAKPLQSAVAPFDEINIDGRRMTLEAQEEITLRCGKASIQLNKAGKIIIRGAYLLNRSSGVNRIKGGSVQIN